MSDQHVHAPVTSADITYLRPFSIGYAWILLVREAVYFELKSISTTIKSYASRQERQRTHRRQVQSRNRWLGA